MKNNKPKTILVGVKTAQEAAQEAIKAWKRAEHNEPVEKPVERIYFPSEELFFSAMSVKRRELLKFLRRNGPMSIKQLSEQLDRQYKNVHTDIKLLEKIGLVELDSKTKVFCPWDVITLEMALAA
jgi:predicted transcriptional regulator